MTEITGVSEGQRELYYNYLENLRKSGVCNMFGSAPYLEEAYNLDRNTARAVVKGWMDDYDEWEQSLKDRAKAEQEELKAKQEAGEEVDPDKICKPGARMSRHDAQMKIFVYGSAWSIDDDFERYNLRVKNDSGKTKSKPTRSDKEWALINFLSGGEYYTKEGNKVVKHEALA